MINMYSKMKKLIVFTLGLLTFITPMPALSQSNIEIRYSGDIHSSYGFTTSVSTELGDIKTYQGRVTLGTVQGVSIGKYGDVGIGFDALMYTHYYTDDGLRFTALPYLSLRPAYPLDDNISVMADLAVGHYIPCINHKDGVEGGTFTQFGAGFRFHRIIITGGVQTFGSGKGSTTFYAKLGIALGNKNNK